MRQPYQGPTTSPGVSEHSIAAPSTGAFSTAVTGRRRSTRGHAVWAQSRSAAHRDSVSAFGRLGAWAPDGGRPSRPEIAAAGGCADGGRWLSGFEQTGVVPSRRKPKPPKPEPQDPVVQFATLLRESAERERAAQDRHRLERQRARAAADSAAAHAVALDAARRQLEDAISNARKARRTGSGVAAADEAWRQAKARLIELETGAPPPWARHDTSDAPEGHDGTDAPP
jgi:hypothetical protein